MANGTFFDEDYYDSLLAEIREIRLSERRFYQKITDIYATSVDYDSKSPTTIKFYLKLYIIGQMLKKNIWGLQIGRILPMEKYWKLM